MTVIGKTSRAFAPATTGNVAVGFDNLGFALDIVGDTANVEVIAEPKVIIDTSDPSLPKEPRKNTAGLGLLHLIEDLKLNFGFKVSIEKGIALGSGMGGSAASSAAAVTAANALLPNPLSDQKLLAYALIGESVATHSFHADNIAPCMLGGLTSAEVHISPEKILGNSKDYTFEIRAKDLVIDVIQIPIPDNIYVVLVHPHIMIETKSARAILKPTVSLKDHVQQSASLIKFISGCYTNNIKRISESLIDHLIEPQRAHLIPGFLEAKKDALKKGALGFSISGAGPSVFAWTENKKIAEEVRLSTVDIFLSQNLQCDSWISPISQRGARCIT